MSERLPKVNGRKYWWEIVVRESPPVRWLVGQRGPNRPEVTRGRSESMTGAVIAIEREVRRWEK